MAHTQQTWSDHALEQLSDAGYRRGGARQCVIELLEEQACALSALDIEDELRARGGRRVGRASIYRVLDELVTLGLLSRVDVGDGVARRAPAPARPRAPSPPRVRRLRPARAVPGRCAGTSHPRPRGARRLRRLRSRRHPARQAARTAAPPELRVATSTPSRCREAGAALHGRRLLRGSGAV